MTITKVMFIGDVHGNKPWLKSRLHEANKAGCDFVIQLGDLGYGFPRKHEDELHLADYIAKRVKKYNMPFYFIDGNHDNHPEIWRDGEDLGPMRLVRPGVYYIKRGNVVNLGGIKLLGLGGAFSIDKAWRIQKHQAGHDHIWWPTETMTLEDKELAIENGTNTAVDIMVTHDAPWNVLQHTNHPYFGTGGHKDDLSSLSQQQIIKDVMLKVKPKLLIHGHWHHRYNGTFQIPFTDESIKVVGLGRDGNPTGAIILRLPADLEGEWA